MTKTKEFTIECSNIRVSPSTGHFIRVTIEEPDMQNIFQQFNGQFSRKDITRYIAENINPEDVYPPDTLIDWAQRNGYAKIDQD